MTSLKLKALFLIVTMSIGTSAFAGLVNINKADGDALAYHLKGVGAAKAEAIVTYRQEHGVFSDIKDLVNVKGIGEGILKKNLEDLSLTEGAVVMVKESATKTEKKIKKPVVISKAKESASTKSVEKQEKVAQVVKKEVLSKVKTTKDKGLVKAIK